MNQNINNYDLLEADLYDYLYMVEKNRQNNTITTVFFESIKIVASILITYIIECIATVFCVGEINVTVAVTVVFVIIYGLIQFITFSCKKIRDAVYNKRSRTEIVKINEFLFHKVATNYINKADSLVKEINCCANSESCVNSEFYINNTEIAIKYFKKSQNIINEIIPYEESIRYGRREKANAVYLSQIGCAEIKQLFSKTEDSLNELKLFIDTTFENTIAEKYNNEILDALTFFQVKLSRVHALEKIYKKLI